VCALGFQLAAEEAGLEARVAEATHFIGDSEFAAHMESVGRCGMFIADGYSARILRSALLRSAWSKWIDQVQIVLANPELSTDAMSFSASVIDVRAELLGQVAVERLLWRIQHPEASERIRTLVGTSQIRASRPAERGLNLRSARAKIVIPQLLSVG
jgi:hypothetical protein